MAARAAQPGRLAWSGRRPARRAEMGAGAEAGSDAAGIAGDHGRAGPRAVTLVQAEHLAAVGSYLGRRPVEAALLRRNLVVAGLNLSALKGRRVRIGSAVLEITGVCAPCSRMEAALGPGGYAALRGHGGWCAAGVVPGRVAVGEAVVPLPPDGTGAAAETR
jgi:MOSC domain-containing protein YiiM